ncbi:unnamed protein product, partial [Mesorhabditis spiculigera]
MRQLFWISLFLGLIAAGVIVKESPVPKDAKLNRHFITKALMSYTRNRDPEVRSASCGLCRLLVDFVQIAIKSNRTDEAIMKDVEALCRNLNVEQPHVCNSIVQMFGPEIIFVLQRAVFTPDEICGGLVADCGHSENPLQEMWNMTIPEGKPPVKPWPTVPSGKPTMRVLHLSDIHIDRWYSVGSDSDCNNGKGIDAFGTYALCCREYPPTAANREQKASKSPAGPWGATARCDIPYQTFDSAMRYINRTEKFDYIMVTGDFEAHDMWDYTRERTKANIENITAVLREYFPHTPIYQTIGNHEGVPMDGMPAHTMDGYDTHSPEWLYKELADQWKPDITAKAYNDVIYRASYSIYIKPNLKLVSLNSVYCSAFNFFMYLDQVHIISHIPTGDGYCLKGWASNYYKIVNRFENTIAAQFFGHTHNDHFEVFYEDFNPKGRPTHFNFIAGSLTTYDFMNPSYRIYTIDGAYTGSTYTVIDAETYWGDVNEANKNNREPDWKLEYTTKKEYKMPDLSPASWNDLINRFDNDAFLFQKFHTHYYRNKDQEPLCPFEEKCRKEFTCALRSARSYDSATFCPA